MRWLSLSVRGHGRSSMMMAYSLKPENKAPRRDCNQGALSKVSRILRTGDLHQQQLARLQFVGNVVNYFLLYI
jgi:hypothetical protein